MTQLLMEAADETLRRAALMSHEGGYSSMYVPYCGLAVLEEMSGHPDRIARSVGTADGRMGATWPFNPISKRRLTMPRHYCREYDRLIRAN